MANNTEASAPERKSLLKAGVNLAIGVFFIGVIYAMIAGSDDTKR